MVQEDTPRFSDPVVCFGSWNRSIFGSPIRHYAEILRSRVMPVFDDLDGERKRIADDVLAAPHWGPDDLDSALEAAYEHSLEHTLEFMELRTVFLATGVAGLFHLFEKQLYGFLNHELRRNLTKSIERWEDAVAAIDTLDQPKNTSGQTELQAAFNASAIKELRFSGECCEAWPGKDHMMTSRLWEHA